MQLARDHWLTLSTIQGNFTWNVAVRWLRASLNVKKTPECVKHYRPPPDVC
jgi:hypothetical protein